MAFSNTGFGKFWTLRILLRILTGWENGSIWFHANKTKNHKVLTVLKSLTDLCGGVNPACAIGLFDPDTDIPRVYANKKSNH